MAVNSRWWQHKIWNTLHKWQSWGPRHKQTHKSTTDRCREDREDRHPLPSIFSFHLQCPGWTRSQSPAHFLPLVFQRPGEKVFAPSMPLVLVVAQLLCKVELEHGVGVGVSQWVMGTRARGPQKDPNERTVGRRMKEKKKEGEMKGGQFKGSECQVLMCLFSITAVPGNDRARKQTATLIYYIQTFNSILEAVSLEWKCLHIKSSRMQLWKQRTWKCCSYGK